MSSQANHAQPPKVLKRDLFNSNAQTLVNTVNTEGIMGKGIALQFRKRYPEMYKDYVRRCEAGEVRLGRPYLYKQLVQPWILNFPTKGHWRSLSRLADIVEGLRYLKDRYKEWGITSLAVPPLGAGNGGLEWRVVGPTLYRAFSTFDIPVEIYAPFDVSDHELTGEFLGSDAASTSTSGLRVQPAWVALVEILNRIEQQPYRWPVGRIAFQKLAYFATSLGLPTGLHFERGSYGPFSSALKRIIGTLLNNGLLEEQKTTGQMILTTTGPTYRDAAKLFRAELADWEQIIERIVDLFVRLRSRDAELAATVHFAAAELASQRPTPTEADVFEAVRAWKQRRKPPFAEVDVAEMVRGLNLLGLINLPYSAELPVTEDDPVAA